MLIRHPTISPGGVIAILDMVVGTCMGGRALKDLPLDLKMPEMLRYLDCPGFDELLLRNRSQV
jgi:hypothetical protein